MFDAGYRMLGASALGWPRGMVWGGGGKGVLDGEHVYTRGGFMLMYGKPIQYCKVKKKKRKKKILITLLLSFYYTTFHFLPSVIEMQLTYTFFFYIIILKNCLTQMSTGALLNCLGLSNFQRSHPGKIPSLPQDFWGFLENLTKILTSAGVLLLTERQTSCCIPSTPQ